jgi:hypothetical protein
MVTRIPSRALARTIRTLTDLYPCTHCSVRLLYGSQLVSELSLCVPQGYDPYYGKKYG